jgi:hypothetical protein
MEDETLRSPAPPHRTADMSPPLGPDVTRPETRDAALPADGDDANNGVIDYNPADYRWVPVRRRPRLDGWTEEKQRRFIEALADTGIVSHAAKSVGMTRESAARLRRSPQGAAFARAWDAARDHAGSFLEDVAFERAIEGVEQSVFNEYGEVICTKRVYNDRLLTFLLSHLKPERYGRNAHAVAARRVMTLEASLSEMEPQLPAPPENLLDSETLAHEIGIAENADGVLPQFLSEQRPAKTAARLAAEEMAAQDKRGEDAAEKLDRKDGELSMREFQDMCRYIDPVSRNDLPTRRYR